MFKALFLIKKEVGFLLIVLILSVAHTNAFACEGCYSKADSLDLDSRINLIDSKVVDLTDIFALHHVNEFNDIYNAPTKFRDAVLRYLQKPASKEKKVIAICSMTSLPLDKYVEILNSYFLLYNKGEITEWLLDRCIFNEFDTNFRIAKQYNYPPLRRFLTQLLRSKSLSSEFKTAVRQTLDGKWYHHLKKAGQINRRRKSE